MPVPRRNFMKLFGASLGSLLLARCQRAGKKESAGVTACYATMDPAQHTRNGTAQAPYPIGRIPLRLCWLRFDELAARTAEGANAGANGDDPLGAQIIAEHRSALDELVSSGDITATVADLIQEAYAAAVYHVWRSNAPMTCYDTMYPDYAPAGAESLVQQAEVLRQIASGGTVAPETAAKAQTALEHDLAFYSLTDADVQALYDRLAKEYGDPGETLPAFEEVELALTPDVKAAAQFLLEVLTGT